MFFRARNLAVCAVLCAAIVPSGCSQTPPCLRPKPKLHQRRRCSRSLPAAPALKLVPRRDADDTARFMAGLPGKPESPYLELESHRGVEGPCQASGCRLGASRQSSVERPG